ncbi:MAG TPA: alcohol dehydrogenase catalytic domain-containing protein [Bryobacteraceae bacterium]|nr:alcohol dehydrogenase catalytic domain-containing protein [Bryobacteraceae bacterium]
MSLQARTAELAGVRRFQLTEREVPDPGPGEIQVRVAAVGICGSDLHSYSEGAVGDSPCIYPMVLGHEPAGVVLKTGPGVTGWSPGDRAAFEPALYCYHCEFCLSGHHNVCANLRFMSNPEEPGFFREYVNLPARNLIAIPAQMSLDHATLIEPLAVVLHSLKLAAIQPGETAAVFGAGPIGLLTVVALKLAGAGRVWAADPVVHRLHLARTVGADTVIDPRAADPARQILEDTGKRGVDVSIDCGGKDGSINQCTSATRNAGRVVVTAIQPGIDTAVNLHTMRRKEMTIFNVRRSNHESADALAMLSEHTARFAPIVTHARPLDEIGRAFAQLENYEDGVGKVVISCSA